LAGGQQVGMQIKNKDNTAFGESIPAAVAFALSSPLAKIDSQDRFIHARVSARRSACVAYVGGNPVSLVDPDGLNSVAPFPPGAALGTIGEVVGPRIRNPICRTPHGSFICGGFITGVVGGALYYELLNLANNIDDDCSNDNNSEEDCKRIKNECIQGCSEFVLQKPRKRRIGLAGMILRNV